MKKILFNLLLLLTIVPAALAQSYSTTLTGAAEVPGPGDPDGAGIAVITIDGTSIRYSVLVQNIGAPTLSHIHRGAAGVAGGPVVDLNVAMLANGTATVSQALADEIRANPSGFYVNVHTAEFAGGAVRGQLSSATSSGGRTAFLPVVGKVAGANNTNFVTDLRIVNHGGATANVTLDFFASSPGGQTAPTATRVITIAPSEQKVLDDVIGATLQASGLGALRIVSDQNVSVTARVINDLRGVNLGTTGFSVTSASIAEAATSGTLSFLSQVSGTDVAAGIGFRTNVGYFNATASPVTLTLNARRTADGSILGTSTITVAAYAMVQQGVFNMIAAVGEADRVQPNFYVTWTASAPLFVYGSVVDNKTGDSVLIQ